MSDLLLRKNVYLTTLLSIVIIISSYFTVYSKNCLNNNNKIATLPVNAFVPDSCYVHNEIIIYFRANSLDLNKLCYTIPNENYITQTISSSEKFSDYLRYYLMNQKFSVDSLIIVPELLNAIKSLGGDTLSRICWDNPCTDTISITRNGDTITSHNFLWMALHFNNDTNAINASILLSYLFQKYIYCASLNYIYHPARIPDINNDPDYGKQISLHSDMCGFNTAWDYQIGNYAIKVAVIDNGIDYFNCDLGNGKFGAGYKVTDGFYYDSKNKQISINSEHGTNVAGIIGAYTNRSKCSAATTGVSGIAGGWGPDSDKSKDDSIGCQLLGFKIDDNMLGGYQSKYAISAIRSSSANNSSGYAVHIINCSWGSSSEYADLAMRAAINYAYQNNVSVVICSGNLNNNGLYLTDIVYPASFDPAWVIKVGASNKYKYRKSYSIYGEGVDLIAPGGIEDSDEGGDTIKYDKIVYTTGFDKDTTIRNSFHYFRGTSAATPHVAGLVALLRAEALEKGWSGLEPEDYEGMIKASAFDITGSFVQDTFPTVTDYYNVGYDKLTGWGHLQADTLFNMLLANPSKQYIVSHFSTSEYIKKDTLSKTTSLRCIFHNDNSTNKPWDLDSNIYSVIPYKVTYRYILPNNWLIDDLHKLYVWGRSGGSANSGLDIYKSDTDVVFQSGFSRVISGSGGNGIVDGIIHSDSLTVIVENYQYHVWSQDMKKDLGLIPPDSLLRANFSVFGCVLNDTTSVNEDNKIITNNYTVSLFPQPAIDKVILQIELKEPTYLNYAIYDILGNKIREFKDDKIYYSIQIKEFDISNLSPGIYFLNILSKDNSQTMKIILKGE